MRGLWRVGVVLVAVLVGCSPESRVVELGLKSCRAACAPGLMWKFSAATGTCECMEASK